MKKSVGNYDSQTLSRFKKYPAFLQLPEYLSIFVSICLIIFFYPVLNSPAVLSLILFNCKTELILCCNGAINSKKLLCEIIPRLSDNIHSSHAISTVPGNPRRVLGVFVCVCAWCCYIFTRRHSTTELLSDHEAVTSPAVQSFADSNMLKSISNYFFFLKKTKQTKKRTVYMFHHLLCCSHYFGFFSHFVSFNYQFVSLVGKEMRVMYRNHNRHRVQDIWNKDKDVVIWTENGGIKKEEPKEI